MDRQRRPREPGADDLAEESNRRAEDMGLVDSIGERTDDERLDELEPHERDYRSGANSTPREPTANPFKNLRGS